MRYPSWVWPGTTTQSSDTGKGSCSSINTPERLDWAAPLSFFTKRKASGLIRRLISVGQALLTQNVTSDIPEPERLTKAPGSTLRQLSAMGGDSFPTNALMSRMPAARPTIAQIQMPCRFEAILATVLSILACPGRVVDKRNRTQKRSMSFVETLVMIMVGVSVPVRVKPLPAVEMAYDYRRRDDPRGTGPINILAVADSHVFISVPSIIVRCIFHITCRRRNRRCNPYRGRA